MAARSSAPSAARAAPARRARWYAAPAPTPSTNSLVVLAGRAQIPIQVRIDNGREELLHPHAPAREGPPAQLRNESLERRPAPLVQEAPRELAEWLDLAHHPGQPYGNPTVSYAWRS